MMWRDQFNRYKRFAQIAVFGFTALFLFTISVPFSQDRSLTFFTSVYAAEDQVSTLITQMESKFEDALKAAQEGDGATSVAAAKTKAKEALSKLKEANTAGDQLYAAAAASVNNLKSAGKNDEAEQITNANEEFNLNLTNAKDFAATAEANINSAATLAAVTDQIRALVSVVNDLNQALQKLKQAAGTASVSSAGGTETTPTAPAPSSYALENPLGNVTSLTAIAGSVIRMFLGVVGALALLVFVYGGILYMTAGSSDRAQKAKDTLKYGVLGLFIIMFSFILTDQFIQLWTVRYIPVDPPERIPGAETAADEGLSEVESISSQSEAAANEAASGAGGGAQTCTQLHPNYTCLVRDILADPPKSYTCDTAGVCPAGTECCKEN